MKKGVFVLFENKVYSTDPEDPRYQFMGPDPMYYTMINNNTDEQLFEVINYYDFKPKNILDNLKIFLVDEVITAVRNEIREYQTKNDFSLDRAYRFHWARKVITDDRYPVNVEYYRKFKRMTAKRKTELMLGNYSIEFGRLQLLYMIQSAKYEPAIPEMREIILHDSDARMVRAAIWVLRDIPTKKSTDCIARLLLHDNLPFWDQYKLVSAVEDRGSPELVTPLRKVFEDNYYYYPDDYMHIYYKATIQQEVLEACSKIPTLGALELLEMGIAHPYDHIEIMAYNCIKTWTRLMLARIENGQDEGCGLKVAEVIKRYDLKIFKESYSSLKKSVQLFKKL